MLFSIIMPIYHVEKYLRASIDSVLKQGFVDYELILVDDGGDDSCPYICDEYSRKFNQVRVIHKKNGGLSDARNAGLSISKGKYIVFIDSDDLMVDNTLADISDELNKNDHPDVLIGNMLNLDGDKLFCRLPFNLEKIDSSNIWNLMNDFVRIDHYIPWAAYQSVYKRAFLNSHNLKFDKNIIGAEDCDFFMKLASFNPSIGICNLNYVIYRMQREGSIITSPKYNAIIGQLVVFDRCYEQCKKKNQALLTRFFADRFTNIIILISYLSGAEATNCVKFIDEHKFILHSTSNSAKYFFSKIIWQIFGFYKGSKILRKIKH